MSSGIRGGTKVGGSGRAPREMLPGLSTPGGRTGMGTEMVLGGFEGQGREKLEREKEPEGRRDELWPG